MRLFRELMMKDVRLSGWRGVLCCAVVLRALSGTGRPASSSELGPSVIRSLALLAKSAQTYTEQRTCFSCHHQTLAVLALQQARGQGFEVAGK